MTPGLVSIIVPVFDRPGPLVEAVESALAQTYRPIEIVVVDDGSTDETPDVAARLMREHASVIRVVRRENGGPGAAREAGRGAAAGEFLQYLDSDDLLLPRKLELQVAALRASPECDIAYGACRETESDGSERRPAVRPSDVTIERMFPTFLATRWWNTVAPLYRSQLCARAGAWSDLRLEEDWEYDARVAALGPRLAFVPELVAEHRDLGRARLSRGGAHDRARLAWRAAAHVSIAASARRAGLGPDLPEARRFSRELFQLARWCAAEGLTADARRLVAAAVELAGRGAATRDVRVFGFALRLLGGRLAGRMALGIDRRRGH